MEEVESIFSMNEALESKKRKLGPCCDSDQDLSDEEIAADLMETTALCLADPLENEPAHDCSPEKRRYHLAVTLSK